MAKRKSKRPFPGYTSARGPPFGMPMFLPPIGFPFPPPVFPSVPRSVGDRGPLLVPPPPPPVSASPGPPEPPREPLSEENPADLNLDLPAPEGVTDVLIFEFDRALFHTPTPNLDLWGTAAARIVETGLKKEGWWASPTFLEAANKHCGEWNAELLDILRLAVATPGVFTAVISGRTEENEVEIRKMLAEHGVENIDCLVLGDALQQIRVKKAQLATRLWSHFRFSSRLTIYEGRPKHARGLRNVLASLATEVRNGLLLHEVLSPLVLFPPLVERELVEAALKRYNAVEDKPISAEVIVRDYVHRISSESRAALCQELESFVAVKPDRFLFHPAKPPKTETEGLSHGDMLEWFITSAFVSHKLLSITCSRVEDSATEAQFQVCHVDQPDGRVTWFTNLETIKTRVDLERRLNLYQRT